MNIVIFGAGAIGSFFGSMLSKNNNVVIIGRKPHIDTIKKNGLIIEGKTKQKIKINCESDIDNINFDTDLLILTVKSYDTEIAIKEAKKIIKKNTIILSLQNGLDNIENIKKYVSQKNIMAGITTQGVFFKKPGNIVHTGIGKTILGEMNGKITNRIDKIIKIFNEAGIKTSISTNINKEIWIKAIVNSSVNPLTTYFQCKNGYLLKNPILEKLVEKICVESIKIANANKIILNDKNIIKETKNVIKNTSENYSSMLQSFNRGKKTEIDSINGKLVDFGRKFNIEVPFNELLVRSIISLK